MYSDILNPNEDYRDYERNLQWYQDKFNEVTDLLKECKNEILDTRAERDEFHEDAKRIAQYAKDAFDVIEKYRDKNGGKADFDTLDIEKMLEDEEGQNKIEVYITDVEKD